jgi:bifunctional non-homologous end joining protein LigD
MAEAFVKTFNAAFRSAGGFESLSPHQVFQRALPSGLALHRKAGFRLHAPDMLRSFQPCLPTRVMKAPSGDRWVHEIKHDGFRLIARRGGATVKLYTRRGCDWSKRYPLITEAIARLRVSSIVLDGEAMCFDCDGGHDFDALWNRTSDHSARLCAFDLLELNGEDYRNRPLFERKKQLARLLKTARDGLDYVEHLEGDGAKIFEHVCKLKLEGIVSKRVDLSYQSGPSRRWLKVKNRAHPAIIRVREAFEEERRNAALDRRMKVSPHP